MTAPGVVSSDSGADRHWGAGIESLFGEHPRTLAPWPRAAKRKQGRHYAPEVLASALVGDQRVTPVDPRRLWSSQGWVTAAGVRYYLGHRYERTGRTFADHHVVANRLPIVWESPTGRWTILTGHHRSAAALVQGRQLLARLLPSLGEESYRSLTPLLHVGTPPGIPQFSSCDRAAAEIRSGRPAGVPHEWLALRTLGLLGVDGQSALTAARFARTGCLAPPTSAKNRTL